MVSPYFQIFSGLVTFYLWFAAFFVLSVISDPAVPINIDYRIEDKEIIIARGFWPVLLMTIMN